MGYRIPAPAGARVGLARLGAVAPHPGKTGRLENNLCRIAQADDLPFKKSTFYKWVHLGKHPQIFVKIGGAVFVDLNSLAELIEAGRLSRKARKN